MTEATHLNLDNNRLRQTTREHCLRAASELRELVVGEWPAKGSGELERRVVELDGKLVEAAIYARRLLDLKGHKTYPRHEQRSLSNAHLVGFSDLLPDLRLASNKIVHHKMMHAEDSGSTKISTITSECDEGTFTKVDITAFCDAIDRALADGQKA